MKTAYHITEYYDAGILRKIIPLVEKGRIPSGRDEKDLDYTATKLRKFIKESEMEGDQTKHLTIYEGFPNTRLAPRGTLGIGGLPRFIRHSITYGIYRDWDIPNCQPTLALDYAIKHQLTCDNLKEYVENRKEFLDRNNFSKDDMFVVFFSTSRKTDWSKEVNNLANEVSIIRDYVYENHKKEFKNIKRDNPKGSVFAKLLQSIERKILDTCYDFFKLSGIDESKIIPCHDGFMALIDINIDCEALSQYVYDKQEIKVSFIEKPIKKWEGEEDVKDDKYYEVGKHKILKEDYDKWLQTIKDTVFQIKSEKTFIKVIPYEEYNNKSEFITFSSTERDVEHVFYQDLTSQNLFKFYAKGVSGKEISYDKFDFLPTPLKCPANIKNLWEGYRFDRVELEIQNDEYYMNMLHKYLDHMSSGNKEVKNFLIKWIARIIQYPAKKTGVGIFITGDEGGGRGTFTNMMINLLGTEYATQVNEPEHVLGRFNDLIKDCIYLNLDELSIQQFNSYRTKIKNTITDQIQPIEPKGKKAFKVRSCINVVLTSNMEHAVAFGKDDRRFVALEIGVMNPSFGAEFNNLPEDAWYCFFKYFKEIEHNPDENLQVTRPKTEFYNSIKLSNRPYIYTFVVAFLQNYDKKGKYTTYDMYLSYKRYMEEQGCNKDTLMKRRGLTDKLLKIDGFEFTGKRNTSGNPYISIDDTLIKKWLVESKHYTQEEIDDEFGNMEKEDEDDII